MMLLQVQRHSNLEIFMQQIFGVTKRNDQGSSSPRRSKTMQALCHSVSRPRNSVVHRESNTYQGVRDEWYWKWITMTPVVRMCVCVFVHTCGKARGQLPVFSSFSALGLEAESLTSLELTNCLAGEPEDHLFPPASVSSGLWQSTHTVYPTP